MPTGFRVDHMIESRMPHCLVVMSFVCVSGWKSFFVFDVSGEIDNCYAVLSYFCDVCKVICMPVIIVNTLELPTALAKSSF